MLLDVNVLLYAENVDSPFHPAASRWLATALDGASRVGIPWPTLLAFVRIRTDPRVYPVPLTGPAAWSQVQDWIDASRTWIPAPTDGHAAVLGGLIERYQLSGRSVPDAHLAALAIEHGVPVASADTGFARYEEIRWINPLRG